MGDVNILCTSGPIGTVSRLAAAIVLCGLLRLILVLVLVLILSLILILRTSTSTSTSTVPKARYQAVAIVRAVDLQPLVPEPSFFGRGHPRSSARTAKMLASSKTPHVPETYPVPLPRLTSIEEERVPDMLACVEYW